MSLKRVCVHIRGHKGVRHHRKSLPHVSMVGTETFHGALPSALAIGDPQKGPLPRAQLTLGFRMARRHEAGLFPSFSLCLSVCFSLPFLLSLFSTPLHHRPYSLSSPVSSPSPFSRPHWGSAQRAGAEVRLGVSRAGRAPPPPPPAWGLGHPREHKGGHLHRGLQDLEEDKGMSPEFRGASGGGIFSPSWELFPLGTPGDG